MKSSVRLLVALGAALVVSLAMGRAAQAFDPFQCGSPAVPPCWTTFQVDGGPPPPGVQLQIVSDGGNIQATLMNGGGFELSPALTTSSAVHMVINVGTYDPVVLGTTGLVSSYSVTTGPPNTITLDVKPRGSSWRFDGCTISACGDLTTTADVDFASLVLAGASDAAALPVAVRDALRGTWVSTNAQAFSLPPTFDPATGAFTFTLAAPHLKHDGVTVNTGFFRTFLPDALVVAMGIPDPTVVTSASFGVTTSVGSAPTIAVNHVSSPASGVLIEAGTNPPSLPPFEYSSPKFTIKKASGVSSSVSGGLLTVTDSGSDPIAVGCAGGFVKVDGFDPDTGPAACGSISSMSIGGGPGDNAIDLRGVDPGSFPALTGTAIDGGAGNDTIYPSSLVDDIHCGAGSDTVSYAGRVAGVRMTIGDGPNDGELGEKDNIRADCESLSGGSGADAIASKGGGAHVLDGGPGNDWLSGGLGPDTFICGAGSDLVSYTTRANPLFVTVGGGPVSGEAGEGDSVSADCETVYAGSGDDTLIGDGGGNNLYGFAGNDTLIGNDGNDVLEAGSGANILDGGSGDDKLIARNGFLDTITCGAGFDYAGLDFLDVITDPGNCEFVKRL